MWSSAAVSIRMGHGRRRPAAHTGGPRILPLLTVLPWSLPTAQLSGAASWTTLLFGVASQAVLAAHVVTPAGVASLMLRLGHVATSNAEEVSRGL